MLLPCFYSALRHKHTPWITQWEMCLVVNRSASNTNPTPIAFLLSEVVYTGVRSVFCSIKHRQNVGELNAVEMPNKTVFQKNKKK